MIGALRWMRRHLDVELTSPLLMAAMLIPLVEALFGWTVHTPLDVPLSLHLGILTALSLIAPFTSVRARSKDEIQPRLLWLSVPPLALVMAIVLSARSNIFYTGRALMEGMSVLMVLHVVSRRLRRRTLRRGDVSMVRTSMSHIARFRVWWASRVSATPLPRTTAISTADALPIIVGWLLFVAWLLIALEHRHPAGPILIVAGGLETIALIVMIPEALLNRRLGVRRAGVHSHAHSTRPMHLSLVCGDAPAHPPHIRARIRRQS
jgi:hypothetical protein